MSLDRNFFSFSGLLVAAAEGCDPKGRPAEIRFVEPDEVINLLSAASALVVTADSIKRLGDVVPPLRHVASVNSIVFEWRKKTAEDDERSKAAGRKWEILDQTRAVVHICAAVGDVATARKAAEEKWHAEADTADTTCPNLKGVLVRDFRYETEHIRHYHWSGCCHSGSTSVPCCGKLEPGIRRLLEAGPSAAELAKKFSASSEAETLRELPAPARAELMRAMELPTETERLAIYEGARKASEKISQEERREFARARHAELVALGFSAGVASRIMRASGPVQAREAVKWAHKVAAAPRPLLAALTVMRGDHFWQLAAAVRALGIEPPEGVNYLSGLQRIIAGAVEALRAGLPPEKE